jgi:hypothetical protein
VKENTMNAEQIVTHDHAEAANGEARGSRRMSPPPASDRHPHLMTVLIGRCRHLLIDLNHNTVCKVVPALSTTGKPCSEAEEVCTLPQGVVDRILGLVQRYAYQEEDEREAAQ